MVYEFMLQILRGLTGLSKKFFDGEMVSLRINCVILNKQMERKVFPLLRVKLTVLLGHALGAAKCIFGIPKFHYYALADGIKAILTCAGKGLKTTKQKPPPHVQLLLIGQEFLG